MRKRDRSRVIHLSDAQIRIPRRKGEHVIQLMKRGTLDVALSIPRASVKQTPHEQDEVYFVVRGRGFLHHDGEIDAVAAGDLLFVAAGIEHQIVDVSEDFAVWRLFYGRQGGEMAAAAGA